MSQRVVIPIALERARADVRRSSRRGEPVTVGVPLPRGLASERQAWQIVDGDGRAAMVQTQALDRWPDGSVRWLLVDAQVDAARSTSPRLELVPAATNASEPALRIEEGASTVVVDTGACRVTMKAGASFPFADVEVAGRSTIDPAASAVVIVDRDGQPHRVASNRAVVRTRGPLRATVDVDGRLEGDLGLEVRARIDFFRGMSTVRIALRIRNPQAAKHPGGFWDLGDAGSIYVKDASLTLAVAPRQSGARVFCSPESGAEWQTAASPLELYQDSSGGDNWRSTAHINRERRVPNSFRGYRLRAGSSETSGLRATPVIAIDNGSQTLALAVPQFWQNFPRAVEVSEKALVFRMFPGQYADLHELQGGEQKTHVSFVAFGRDAVSDVPLDWCRARLMPVVDPSWSLATEAIPWLAPDDERHRALVASAIDGDDTFERKREVVDEFGWRNFGDVYGDHEAVRHAGPMPLVSHYNNQYDALAGFIYQFARSGDTRWWTLADELASHVIDIDIYHTERDKAAYNHGLFWHTYHYGDADTATHRTYPRTAKGTTHGGGPSADHNYTTGLMLHWFLTGSEDSRDTAVDLARYVLDLDDGRRTPFRWLSAAPTGFVSASGSYAYHGPGRSPANSVNALVDGHRLTRDDVLIQKAEEIIRRVVHPDEDITRHRLDDPEERWFYLMFLQSLGKYLGDKIERGQLDDMYAYGRASLLHYARWMAEREYPYLERPEKLTFPTETWAAHEIRKSDVFAFAALHASGAERERFLERARFFFANAVDTLRGMRTRTLARPVIVLLSSGLMMPWIDAHAGAAAPQPRTAPRFAPQPAFVPQRQRAIRRAKVLLASGAAALASIAGYWLLHL